MKRHPAVDEFEMIAARQEQHMAAARQIIDKWLRDNFRGSLTMQVIVLRHLLCDRLAERPDMMIFDASALIALLREWRP